jgi:hypothetical protein
MHIYIELRFLINNFFAYVYSCNYPFIIKIDNKISFLCSYYNLFYSDVKNKM